MSNIHFQQDLDLEATQEEFLSEENKQLEDDKLETERYPDEAAFYRGVY